LSGAAGLRFASLARYLAVCGGDVAPLRTKAPVSIWAGILRVQGRSDTEYPGVPPLDDDDDGDDLLPQAAGWAEGRKPL